MIRAERDKTQDIWNLHFDDDFMQKLSEVINMPVFRMIEPEAILLIEGEREGAGGQESVRAFTRAMGLNIPMEPIQDLAAAQGEDAVMRKIEQMIINRLRGNVTGPNFGVYKLTMHNNGVNAVTFQNTLDVMISGTFGPRTRLDQQS